MKASQMLKYPPAMQETWVQFLGWEDPLENGMATYSSILAWRIPVTEEPRGLPSMGSHRVRHDWGDLAAAAIEDYKVRSIVYFREGNGTPLQYSSLENPMDGGAW